MPPPGDILDALRGPTRLLNDPELPQGSGFYAWWGIHGCLSGVVAPAHPVETDRTLLYVGIAPVRDASTSTIRSRVQRNHLGGNIAASTLRFSLAALLQEEWSLVPYKRGTKVVLSDKDNERLSAWQISNLRLTWHKTASPRSWEKQVIEQAAPPLNLEHNSRHPFFSTLKAARARLRKLAKLPL